MVLVALKCPHCNSESVKKAGLVVKTQKQRYQCQNNSCKKYFHDDYSYNACNPDIRSQIYIMTVNGNCTRAIARTLGISTNTVTAALRNIEYDLWYVNLDYIREHNKNGIEVDLVTVEEAEMDEMWSFVHDKSQQYWLWWAIDHNTGVPLAFCFGTREYKYLDELKARLAPFNIETIYTDDNQAYDTKITHSWLVVGKENTQKIENKHLSLRTWCSRLIRKGIRFSKRHDMHRIVIALVINFWFFGRVLW